MCFLLRQILAGIDHVLRPGQLRERLLITVQSLDEVRMEYDSTKHVKMNTGINGMEFTVEPFFSAEDRMTAVEAHAATRPKAVLVSGPAIQTGEYTFRIDPDYFGKDPRRQWTGITVCLEADGDAEYKSAVQEINIRPAGLE